MNESSLSLKHFLVICSRDRVQSLLATLENIRKQEIGACPNRILLVLNLEKESDLFLLKSGLERLDFMQVKIIRTLNGLPSARNLALREVADSDIVHFIDDDVLVGNDYFLSVEKFLQAHPDASGGAPIDRSKEILSEKSYVHSIKEMYGLIEKPGFVTKSFRNYWGRTTENESFQVDWLPGLAMFFRSRDLVGRFFEERLEKCTLGGYGLGEDLFFTLSLSTTGKKLFAVPSISVSHLHLPNISNSSDRVDFARGELKAHLFQAFPGLFNKSVYFKSLFVELILIILKSPRNFSKSFKQAIGELTGFLRTSNHGIHD